jgi:hypothetical protein
MAAAGEWEAFCDDFFKTYQEEALRDIGAMPIIK